jgi:flagellar hook assembly protein FlgD
MNMKLVWHKTMDALCLIAGVNRVEWNGINDYGMQVANGVYICEISTSGKTVRKSMALIRNAE